MAGQRRRTGKLDLYMFVGAKHPAAVEVAGKLAASNGVPEPGSATGLRKHPGLQTSSSEKRMNENRSGMWES